MCIAYPLRFQPILRRYLWGGRRLGTVLGKPIGPESDYAESWEICDRAADQSVVLAGPSAGAMLGDLVRCHGQTLLGRHHPQPRFPLLFKFLDCHQTLSIQVHPNDRQAAQLTPPDLGKTEAWVILDAAPDSLIYAGLKPGVDRRELAQLVAEGRCEQCLHHFHPEPGDCILLPPGIVHSLGAGILVAEVQQSSDATFRLFDFNRLAADGLPRPLHVEQALEVIDYQRGPVGPLLPRAGQHPHVELLAECDKFVLSRWRLDCPDSLGGDDLARIVTVVSGSLDVTGDAVARPLSAGGTILLPAGAGEVDVHPRMPTVALVMHLP